MTRNPSPHPFVLLLAAIALVLSGAIAGFFYAYSSSVMRGLDAAPPAAAIAAMQGINAQVRNAVFAPAFFGAPITCALAALLLLATRRRSAGVAMALAALIYLGGALLPTFAVNVPMNEALALVEIPIDPTAAKQLWADYSSPWTWWNHMRTAMSLVSLLCVGGAIYLMRKPAS